MIFKYGSYSHDQDEVMLRITSQGIFDKFQRRMGDVHEWTILGVKKVASDPDPEVTKANLTTALDALIDAYNVDYEDAGLYLNDGTTLTRHAVTNSECFGGVKVVQPPSFLNGPWTGRVEYLDRRTYIIVLRFEIRVGDGYYSYRERIRIKGTGAAKWRYSPQMVGDAQAQTLQTATTFWYIQEGEAVGREDFVAPNDALFPSIVHGEMTEFEYTSAEDIVVGGAEMYGTKWKYFMEATTSQGFSAFDVPSVSGF